MPRRGEKGYKNPNVELRKQKHKEMLMEAPALCKSQVYNALYDKLRRDKRLDRFIAIVQYCSMSGLNIEESVKVICKSFPGYINEKDMTIACFEDMIKNYHDISVAWGYGDLGDEISQIIVKNKALKIVEKTESMADIAMYNALYGKKKEEVSSDDKKTTVNFNLFKR